MNKSNGNTKPTVVPTGYAATTSTHLENKSTSIIEIEDIPLSDEDVPENFLEVITKYRIDSKQKLSMRLIKLLLDEMTIDFQNPEKSTFYYDLLYEISINCYYVKMYELGMKVSELMLINYCKIGKNINSIRDNLKFYVKKLECRKIINFSNLFESPKIKLFNGRTPNNDRTRMMNPSLASTFSIFKEGDKILRKLTGFLMVIRCVNYDQYRAVRWDHLSTNEVIQTRNFLLKFDSQLNLKSVGEILDMHHEKRVRTHVEGIEDIRLVSHPYKGIDITKIKFSCATWGVVYPTYKAPYPRIVLYGIKPGIKVDQKSVDYKAKKSCEYISYETNYYLPLDPGDKSSCQKNWLGFYTGSRIEAENSKLNLNSEIKTSEENAETEFSSTNLIRFIYNSGPIQLADYDIKTGLCKITDIESKKWKTHFMRGSAGPVQMINFNGYLTVVHEVINGDPGRIYLHRFVILDYQFKTLKFSNVFFFDHLGIEFCSGLTYNKEMNGYYLGVGLEDSKALVYEISEKKVLELCHDLEIFPTVQDFF